MPVPDSETLNERIMRLIEELASKGKSFSNHDEDIDDDDIFYSSEIGKELKIDDLLIRDYERTDNRERPIDKEYHFMQYKILEVVNTDEDKCLFKAEGFSQGASSESSGLPSLIPPKPKKFNVLTHEEGDWVTKLEKYNK